MLSLRRFKRSRRTLFTALAAVLLIGVVTGYVLPSEIWATL